MYNQKQKSNVHLRKKHKTADRKGGGHSEPSALSEPGSEHNLIGASAFGYVSKITVINTIAIWI